MALQLVVLDVGHGGKQPGAVASDGTPEKSICLAVAMRIARRLKRDPSIRVLLTRREDQTLSLRQRAEIANRLKPAVFVSIHVNASSNPAAKGVETYYLSNTHSDRRARLLAERENADLIQAEEAPTGVLETILKDADTGRMIGESARLARLVQNGMVDAVGGTDRSVRQAPFAVLVRSGVRWARGACLSNAADQKAQNHGASRPARWRDRSGDPVVPQASSRPLSRFAERRGG